MAEKHIHEGETHIVGKRTREWVVNARLCPMLEDYGFQLIGRSAARAGFAFTRCNPGQGQWLGCVRGSGKLWLDEQWHVAPAGHVYLTMPGAMHAYRAVGSGVWQICWVILQPDHPAITPAKPRCLPANVRQMDLAIEGLHGQTMLPPDAPALRHWLNLIDHYIRLTPHKPSGAHQQALDQLWKEVARHPGHPWSMETLAEKMNLSEEHVRRLCVQHYDRPPMDQVRWLRMQHAEMLLLRSDKPIHAIAQTVGYQDPYAFQDAFARVMGITPAAYRHQQGNKG